MSFYINIYNELPEGKKKANYYKLRREWKELKQEYNDLELVFSKISIEFVKKHSILLYSKQSWRSVC